MKRGSKESKFNIDVVIVTRERYPHLIKCVKHICLNSLKPASLIIVDSSSNYDKDTHDIIDALCKRAKIHLIYLKVPHKGVGYSRNVGLQNVDSPYFTFIDDDEYVPKFWLKRIAGVFSSRKNLHVLAGPKIPRDKNNYWHLIWRELSKNEFSYQGRVDSIPSGNSSYKTSFIKNHNLSFDERFKHCSEDQAFSYELRKKEANIYFDKIIWVKHDLRRSLIPFIKQWFYYGVNKHLYQKLYLGSGSISEASKIGRSLRNLKKTFPYLGNWRNIYFLPGVAILNTAFLVGFLYSFLGLHNTKL